MLSQHIRHKIKGPCPNSPFACSTGVAEPISVIDNSNGRHTASYTPANDGAYTVCVKYADQEVPCRSVSQELTMYLLIQLFQGLTFLNCRLSAPSRSKLYLPMMPVKSGPAVQVWMPLESQPVCRWSSPSMPETLARDYSRFRFWWVTDSCLPQREGSQLWLRDRRWCLHSFCPLLLFALFLIGKQPKNSRRLKAPASACCAEDQ